MANAKEVSFGGVKKVDDGEVDTDGIISRTGRVREKKGYVVYRETLELMSTSNKVDQVGIVDETPPQSAVEISSSQNEIKNLDKISNPKMTSREYLKKILKECLDQGIFDQLKMAEVLGCPDDQVQNYVSIYRKLARVSAKAPVKSYCLVEALKSNGKLIFERLPTSQSKGEVGNDNCNGVYTDYAEITLLCGEINQLRLQQGLSKVRVVNFEQSVPHGSSKGRSMDDVLELLDDDNKALDYENEEDDKNMKAKRGGNRYLDLQNKGLHAKDIPSVIAIVENGKRGYNSLGLSHNKLGPHAGSQLEAVLLSSTSMYLHTNLSALFLSDNCLGDTGAECVANVLMKNLYPNLVKLGLNTNNISDVGIQAIAEMLDVRKNPNCSVEVLGLSENYSVTSEGSRVMADAIRHNNSLVRFFFNRNRNICNEGASLIISSVLSHPSLKRLGLASCGLKGEEIGKQLMEMVNCNSAFERICVFGNQFEESIEVSMRKCPIFNFNKP